MFVSLLLACQADPGVPHAEVSVELAPAMPTVAHVLWSSTEATLGRITIDGGPEVVDVVSTTDHDLRVIGLHADTDYTGTVWEGDTPVAEVSFTTGALDPAILPLTVTTALEGLEETRYLLFSSTNYKDAGRLGTFSTGVVEIVDRDGIPVWGVALGDLFPMFPVWVPGVGIRCLTNGDGYTASTLDTWDLDGIRTSAPLPGAHHEAAWLDDGTLAYAMTETRDVDGVLVGGDILVEVTPDGTSSQVWDAFEALPVVENWGWEFTSLEDGAADWTHANGMSWLADPDSWLLSLYGPQQVVKIDRDTGGTDWVLGVGGGFTLGPGAVFGPQHSPLPTDSGLLLFDNGTQSSRLLELAVNEVDNTANVVWQWPEDGHGKWNPLLGHIDPLPEGGLVVSWGVVPEVFLFDAERAVVGALAVEDPAFGGALGAIRGLGEL